MKRYGFWIAMALAATACQTPATSETDTAEVSPALEVKSPMDMVNDMYAPVRLTTDLTQLKDYEKEILPILIQAAKVMDEIFWKESYGDREELMAKVSNPASQKFCTINYGPWDRMNDNQSGMEGLPGLSDLKAKPAGAQFYPADMTKEEFEASELEGKGSQYTIIRRNDQGALIAVPYHEAFAEEVGRAAELLVLAGEIAKNAGDTELATYLNLRAEALRTDQYDASDIAWLDLKNNGIDIIIGPIEHYEDQLFNIKTAHEAYVLVKDREWSKRLERYVALLPDLQTGLPVADKYKQESPGTSSQLNAYDVVYYAGDCNSGGKTIAVNLPNDEAIQTSKGTRRSQLKNAMRAKYEEILVPISGLLIDESQRKHITFDAFFGNTMFHEVAHGLGIKNTINGKGYVREALKEKYSALEEGKADILGLYMVTKLFEQGEITEGDVMDNYVTFLAGIFRSVRFGASSAHGKANMLRFNYFKEHGAFNRNETTGTYRVDFEKMQAAMTSLSALILELQGNGDYEGVVNLMAEKGNIDSGLQSDLDRLSEAGIPVDIVFEQGIEVLGL